MIEIDHRHMALDTLDRILTEIVTREGTDYGDAEVSTEDKKATLWRLLDCGDVVMVYYSSEGFCDIISRSDNECGAIKIQCQNDSLDAK